MPRPIEAVVFDMDGVLIDSEPIWRAVERDVFGSVGIELTDADLSGTMGVRIGEVVDRRYERDPWGEPGPRAIERAIVEAVAEAIAAEGELQDGAVEAIDLVDRLGLRLALASSSPMRLIDAVLAMGGLAHRFDVVLSAEDEEHGKPDPAVYLSAARALHVPAQRCLAVEDSVAGVRSAKAAGMVCVAVPDPLADRAALADADLVIASLRAFDDEVWAVTGTEPVAAPPGRITRP